MTTPATPDGVLPDVLDEALGMMPAYIQNPEAWPENYAGGYNDALANTGPAIAMLLALRAALEQQAAEIQALRDELGSRPFSSRYFKRKAEAAESQLAAAMRERDEAVAELLAAANNLRGHIGFRIDDPRSAMLDRLHKACAALSGDTPNG